MGETFHPQHAYAELQPSFRSAAHQESSLPVVNGEEEPYTIKCICGYNDDTYDGATVFCEQCNTWQHISCYYSPNTTLAPDAEHSCIDCNPRQKIDPQAAAYHQKLLRIPQAQNDDRKAKRTNNKSHKKSKTRDLNNAAIQVNGLHPHDTYDGSPSAGSPRDSAPPAKRHKTNHRASLSIGNGRATNGRQRSGSTTVGFPVPPPRPPLDQCPPNFLSPDFIRVHRENTDFNQATANLHLDISVTSLLSTWLDDQDAFKGATGGRTHSDVFKHFPQPIEELETPIQRRIHTEPHVRFHGSVPQWPYLVVDRDLVEGEFVGEIRGCIGKREDYQSDPVNQWNKLRHPDHFVFFHPQLPIYIDARQEGTMLRYARRSCRPNLKMETIITGAREYRFCFMAASDIPQSTEITIAWDTKFDEQLQNALSVGMAAMSPEDYRYTSEFFSKNLAHFGGCACENQGVEGPCLVGLFDRRACKDLPNGTWSDGKGKRKRNTKKAPSHVATHGTNSRESSEEAYGNHDGDVDMLDGRSTTQSTKSSRDATPSNNRHDSLVNGNELSERDKKKLAQQERLFEQMEHDRQGPVQKKKKRNSGSNANTPTLPSSRPTGRSVNSTSNPGTPISGFKGPFAPPARSPANNSPSLVNAGRSVQPKLAPRPIKPVYVDAATQTESKDPPPSIDGRKHVQPRSRQLLRRSLFQSRLQNESRQAQSQTPRMTTAASSANSEAMDMDSPGSRSPSSSEKMLNISSANAGEPAITTTAPQATMQQDVEMASVDGITNVEVKGEDTPIATENTSFGNGLPAAVNPSQPVKPPPPPWPAGHAKTEESSETTPNVAPVAPMHIDLPENDFVKPAMPSMSSPSKSPDVTRDGAMTASVSSPQQVPSLAIPSSSARNPEGNSLTKPSPVKKKMSLSDYMNKRNRPNTSASDKTPTPGGQGSPLGSSNPDEAGKSAPSPGGEETKS